MCASSARRQSDDVEHEERRSCGHLRRLEPRSAARAPAQLGGDAAASGRSSTARSGSTDPGVGLDLEVGGRARAGRRPAAQRGPQHVGGRGRAAARASACSGTWKCTRHGPVGGQPPSSASRRSSVPTHGAVGLPLARLVQVARLDERRERPSRRAGSPGSLDVQRRGGLRPSRRARPPRRAAHRVGRILERRPRGGRCRGRRRRTRGRSAARSSAARPRRRWSPARSPARARGRPGRAPGPVRELAEPRGEPGERGRGAAASSSAVHGSRQPSGSVEMLPSAPSSGSSSASTAAQSRV